MSVAFGAPSRLPWLGALVALFLIWSLYGTDISSMDSSVKQIVGSYPGSAPVNVSLKATESQAEEIDRPLVLYAYADGDTENARDNLKFFIAHALHDAADFVFILNGETSAKELIPQEDNIRIVQRVNDCYDIGSYAEVLQKNDLYRKYKRFIMLNASVRGPMLPYWSEGCWTDMFLSRVTEEVKLVGITANCWPSFHIQTMVMATDIYGIEILLHPSPEVRAAYYANPPKKLRPDDMTPPQPPGINSCFHSWDSAVLAEVSITSLIRAAGYKADSMMSAFHGMKNYPDECDPQIKDLLWDNGYYGINVHPFETVFMKANRNIAPLTLQRHTEWIDARGYQSYHYCKALPRKRDGVAEIEM